MKTLVKSCVVVLGLGLAAVVALAEPDDKSTGKAPKDKPGKSGKVDMSAVPPDDKAEKKAMESVGDDFKLKHTLHYSVLYDTSDADVASFSTAIEGTYRSCMNYVDKLGISYAKPKKKLIIFYFEEHKDYSAYSVKIGKGPREQSTPGVYYPDLNLSMFFNFQNQDSFKAARRQAEARINELRGQLQGASAADRKRISAEIKAAQAQANHAGRQGGDLSEGIVQHEVSHQVLWNIGFHHNKNFFANPRWLAEGTAMMFEPISDGSSANFGAVNTERLEDFRQLDKAGKLIPLKEFISSHKHFGATIAIAYPESWALAHYLNRVKRKQLKTYVEEIKKRPDDYETTPEEEIETFEKAFGKIDEKWIRTWKDWMGKVRS